MIKLNVEEMKCNHCVERINKLLDELKVEHKVDLDTKSIEIAENADINQVISELDDIGFTAKLV